MQTTRFCRILAFFLALVSVLSLLPTVGILDAAAATESDAPTTRATTAENNSLADTVKLKYDSILIPVAQKKNINSSTVGSLAGGIYFIVAWDKDSNKYATIHITDYAERTIRLTADYDDTPPKAATKHGAFKAVAVTLSGNNINQINSGAVRDFTYAFEVQKNNVSITRNTSKTVKEDGITYTGWEGRMEWEYQRDNVWSGKAEYSSHLKMGKLPTSSAPGAAYLFKSLNPTKLNKNPYLRYSTAANGIWTGVSGYPFFLVYNTANGYTGSTKIYKMDHTGGNAFTFWLGWDRKDGFMTSATMSQIVRQDKNKYNSTYNLNQFEMDFQFFRVSPVALDLYNALIEAKPYVTGKNANGQYPVDTYNNFLNFIQSAFSTYNSKRTVFDESATCADRLICDTLAKDVRSYIELLKIEEKYDYMDIPMEVLDFRADGLLFEGFNAGTAYSLSAESPVIPGYNLPRPGTPGDCEEVAGRHYIEGLIESNLVNGKIAYKEETVDYIANAFFIQHHTFDDPAATTTAYKGNFGADDMKANYNPTFMNFIDPITGDRPSTGQTVGSKSLGSYGQTLAKIEENGGYLPYSKITTCYDLAYYTLNHIWSQTRPDDIVQTKDGKNLPYNKKIEELTTMRLLKDSDNVYHFKSDLANGRCLDSGLIFNYPAMNVKSSTYPYLNSTAGLGFEGSDMFPMGSTGGTPDPGAANYSYANYLVMYHVQSSFVYYESKKLNFRFTGDDDVYFFINGQLICDIGGMHSATTRSCDLNAKIAAGEIELKDGDICTFDMYLVDRHSVGVNMNLSTNIDMMPYGAVTDKVQYLYTGADQIGEEVKEGTVVTDNTEVGYGFKLLNRCEHGVQNLSFTDPELGVTLSSEPLNLGGKANVGDLILIYRSYDPNTNTLFSDSPTSVTYDGLSRILSEAIDDLGNVTPMKDQTYMITGLTAQNLKDLMKLGIPANVQISIYGFHRTVKAAVGGYTNTVYTSCTPIAARDTDGNYTYDAPISGFAIRNLYVQNMNDITAEPLKVVLDYGKPIEFTLQEIYQAVSYNPLDAKLTYLGMLTAGEHGKTLFKVPGNLSLQSENTTLETDWSTCERTGDTFRFTPKGMLDTVRRLYAIIQVYDNFLQGSWYLTVAVEFIPASIMYYEAEQLAQDGVLTLTDKTTVEVDVETQPPADGEEDLGMTEDPGTTEDPDATEETEVTEPTEPTPKEEAIYNNRFTHIVDYEDREDPQSTYSPTGDNSVLFFDFGATGNDRYKTALYGNYDFNNSNNWFMSQDYTSKVKKVENGALRIEFCNPHTTNYYYGYVCSSPTLDGTTGFPMTYKPHKDDVCEVRIKVDQATVRSNSGLSFCIESFPAMENRNLRCRSSINIPKDRFGEGYYVYTFSMNNGTNGIPTAFKYDSLSILRRFNILLSNISQNTVTKLSIDYLYIGPKEKAPSAQDNSYIYMGMDNTPADQYRYMSEIYGIEHNFDTVTDGSWTYDSAEVSSLTEEGGNISLTTVAGKENPWIQTRDALRYPLWKADTARVRVKFTDLALLLTQSGEGSGGEVEDDSEAEGYEQPTLRLTFLTDDPTQPESYVEWNLTEEMLADGIYRVFEASISDLWESAPNLKALGLSLHHVTGANGGTGKITIDKFYVGPSTPQDPDNLIHMAQEPTPDLPQRTEYYTPNYDPRVLYMGFDNTAADQNRYINGNSSTSAGPNNIYGYKNFDDPTNWWMPDYSGTESLSIANGALTYSMTINDTWGYIATGKGGAANTSDAKLAEFPLNYKPGTNDYAEIRLKLEDINNPSATRNLGLNLEFFKNRGNVDKTNMCRFIHSFNSMKANGDYFIVHFPLSDATCDRSNNRLLYSQLGTVTRMNVLIGSLTSKEWYKCSIDYIYIGPEELRPSKMPHDQIYIGFEGDAAADYKYNSDTYGANLDLKENWRYAHKRTSAPTIQNGIMSYTVLADGHPWFETMKGGALNDLPLNFPLSKAKTIQVRARYRDLELVPGASTAYFRVHYGYKDHDQADQSSQEIPIPASHYATDDKWFTYTITPEGLPSDVTDITAIRIEFANLCNAENKGTVEIDYIYMGPSLEHNKGGYHRDEIYTYGYDSSYVMDTKYSDSEALYVEGHGVPTMTSDKSINYEGAKDYTEVTFSFTGTGFDLISRTGKQQGTIRVAVYSNPERTYDGFEKAITVNNKGELELYQIPVVSVQGLPHGTHYVNIWVNKPVVAENFPSLPDTLIEPLLRGNEFYIDGIRIYDTIDVTAQTPSADEQTALAAYRAHKEGYHYVKEIRNLLLTKEAFDTVTGTTAGAVFLDINSSNVNPETGEVANPSDNPLTDSVTTYNNIGPKNEVYLAPNQAVAFRIRVDSVEPIVSLDIGAKTIFPGSQGTLAIGFVSQSDGTFTAQTPKDYTLRTATTQYHAVDNSMIRTITEDGETALYMVIYNQSTGEDNVISITDIKVAYDAVPQVLPPVDAPTDPEIKEDEEEAEKPTENVDPEQAPVAFLVDRSATRAVAAFIKAVYETPMDPPTQEPPTTEPPTEEPPTTEPPTEEPPTTKPPVPNILSGITIGHSLNLASDIAINYAVLSKTVEGYEDLSMICTLPVYVDGNLEGERTVVLSPEQRGNYIYFTLTGITAVHMNDTVTAVLTMTKDGIPYETEADVYSVRTYAMSQLNRSGNPPAIKALCANLLRYGADAQLYKGYRTDALATQAMTEEHLSYLTDLDTVVFDTVNAVTTQPEGSTVSWVGKSLLLDSKVTLRYVLDLSQYEGDVADLCVEIRYIDPEGTEKTLILTDPKVYREDKGYYSFDFDGLLAAELRQTVYATAYVGETPVTGTMEYRASTYGNGKTDALGQLCKSLMAYSDSAKAYFAK